MLYSEIIAVCSQIHTKHVNTLCEQNVEFVSVKPNGKYSNHCALKYVYGDGKFWIGVVQDQTAVFNCSVMNL
jgi:hypothetical protein